jgi:hypothetical protein
MEKGGLDDLPEVGLPKGYTLRTFQPGDEPGLARVYDAASLRTETVEKVRARMLKHPCFAK